MPSYATDRKIRILTEHFGTDWKSQIGGKSIDAAYTELTGDPRKNLFCKISPDAKDQLDEMVSDYGEKMAIFVENMIRQSYKAYLSKQEIAKKNLAQQYTNQ